MAESQAILLDRVPYRDRDLILTLLTKDFGVIHAIARGARGSTRRFAAALDLFVVSTVSWTQGKSSLVTLTQASVIKQFPGIFESLHRLEVGQMATVLVRDLTFEAPAGEAMFLHLLQTYTALEIADDSDALNHLLLLAVNLLDEIGHFGRNCPRCGAQLEPPGLLLLADGAVLCRSCSHFAVGVPADQLFTDDKSSFDPSHTANLIATLMSGTLGRPYQLRGLS